VLHEDEYRRRFVASVGACQDHEQEHEWPENVLQILLRVMTVTIRRATRKTHYS
jgi:hypothetical protein